MRGLETNVLVRFLLGDDRRQSKAARTVIADALAAGEPLLLSLLTVLETEWVLRARAGLRKNTIVGAFKQLLESRDLVFESEEALEEALYRFEEGSADFADCLMVAQYRQLGCTAMLTFDVRAARVPGGELLAA
ncbi:MAG TPA: PIN domain-containing protein [Rhizomicrobium sp.]